MLQKKLYFLWSILALVAITNCAGPYKGRLIEATDGAPIAGVVVVGYWTNEIATVGGGVTRCLDARETVSDDKGEFTIPISTYGEFFGAMSVAIYKVGYANIKCDWDSFNWSGGCLKEKPKWEGNRVIIPLKRVEKSKLRSFYGSPPSGGCGRKDGKPLQAYTEEEHRWEIEAGLIKK
jgi:hypothetical protein